MAKSNFGNTTRNAAIMARRRIYQWPLVYALPLFLADGCKKTEPAASAPQPTAVPASTVPSAPTRPVPTISAAQTIGMLVYPKASQTHDQQLIDESDCYNSVQQQTGIDPRPQDRRLPVPLIRTRPRSREHHSAAGSGGVLRGAARGAAGGAAIGQSQGTQAGVQQSVRPPAP
jgi:hypothetical protein